MIDVAKITDKKEIAYLLIQEQRRLSSVQHNCRVLEQQLVRLEQEEAKKTRAALQDALTGDETNTQPEGK